MSSDITRNKCRHLNLTQCRLPRVICWARCLRFPPLTFAQDQPAAGGWKRVGDPAAQTQTAPAPNNPGYAAQQPSGAPADEPMPPPPPNDVNGNGPASYPAYSPQSNPTSRPSQNYQPQQPGYQPQNSQPVPSTLAIPAGTYLTVRVNQLLSSDKNQQGDAFSASLVQPLVVNGVVVAEPGQTLGGRVTEAVKPAT